MAKFELIMTQKAKWCVSHIETNQAMLLVQRYEHTEKAYELLNEACQELSQAGRFKLADRTEALVESLLMKSADQRPEVDQ